MQFDVQDMESCVKKLTVDVSAEDLGARFSETIKEVAKVAQIPGFRPGRVPVDLLRKKFGGHIVTQVFEDLVRDSVKQVIKERGWDLAAPVRLENEKETGVPEEGKPFQFALLLEIEPEINLPQYKQIPLKGIVTDPTDAEIDAAIEQLREQNAKFDEVEGREIQDGDLAVVSYAATGFEGKPLGEVVGSVGRLTSAKQIWVSMDDQAVELVPGMKAKLKGLQVGAQVTVDVTFPEEYPFEKLRGVQATYEVTVDGIREKKLPEVNDAWAETLRVPSLEALRDAISADLVIQKENQRSARLNEQALQYLLDKSVFELPPSILEDETRIAVYDLVERTRQQGADDDFIREKKDDLVKAATQNALYRTKRQYVLGEIAKRESLELEEGELEDFIDQLAAREKEKPRVLLQKMTKDGRIERVKEYLLAQKALEFVVLNANVSEEE